MRFITAGACSKLACESRLIERWALVTMATQQINVATICGVTGQAIADLFRWWRAFAPQPSVVDDFGMQLLANGVRPPIVYSCEWIDHWLMGDEVPGPGAVPGNRFEATCGTRAEAALWADRCGVQFPEQHWLAARLREAAEAWRPLVHDGVVVVARQVLGASTTDEEISATLETVAAWVSRLQNS